MQVRGTPATALFVALGVAGSFVVYRLAFVLLQLLAERVLRLDMHHYTFYPTRRFAASTLSLCHSVFATIYGWQILTDPACQENVVEGRSALLLPVAAISAGYMLGDTHYMNISARMDQLCRTAWPPRTKARIEIPAMAGTFTRARRPVNVYRHWAAYQREHGNSNSNNSSSISGGSGLDCVTEADLYQHEAAHGGRPGWRKMLWLMCASQPMFIAHHALLLGVALPLAVAVDKGHFFLGCFLFSELGNICTHLRTFLALRLDARHWLYIANGVAMAALWFVTRILLLPYMYAVYARQLGLPEHELYRVAERVPLVCIIGSLVFLLPQLYWFALMLRGIFWALYYYR